MSDASRGDNRKTEEQLILVQRLFVKHSGQLRGFVLSLVPGFDEADDILQEVFLTVTAKAHTFEPGTNFPAWASTIARYKVLEALRKRRNSPATLSPEVVELLTADHELVEPDEHRAEALKRCIAKLSPRMRELVERRYKNEEKPRVIAEAIGWTPEAVYVSLSRCRSSLKACIEKELKKRNRRLFTT